MRSALAHGAARLRSSSLSAVPPPQSSRDYSAEYASVAASILYQSPLPAPSGLPLYILNAAAFPDSFEIDYDSLLPYVLERLPGEDDLIAGTEYEVIFFAGGKPDNVTSEKKSGPGIGWYLQAYHVLSRATRKRLQRLWVVHERSWVRVLIEVFSTIVSPKFKKKIFHLNTLGDLAQHVRLENLLIPPAVYLHDRRLSPEMIGPYSYRRRAFGAKDPLPRNYQGARRLPRVLRETTSFLCEGNNLKVEGIFRIPPHLALLGVVKEAYERGQRFIVWKESRTTYVEPGMPDDTLAQIHEADAYSVHLAAALIKVWYRELKIPLFPESSYERIRQQFSSPDADITLELLVELFSPTSQASPLPRINRLIMSSHLLPLLALIVSFEPTNKMTPENISICFAPALVCGSDQLQDAKMTSVLRRLLIEAIRLWPGGLEQACGGSRESFMQALQPPTNHIDYEDPLYEDYGQQDEKAIVSGVHRIQLEENGGSDQSYRPPLPPRSSSLSRASSPRKEKVLPPQAPKRKPAPAVATLPRYSTIINDQEILSPDTYDAPANGFAPRNMVEQDIPAKTLVSSLSPFDQNPSKDTEKPAELRGLPDDSSDDSTHPRRASTTRKPVPSLPAPTLADIRNQGSQLRSVSGDSTKSADEGLFAKPTWAASSRKTSASSIESQRRASPPLSVPKNMASAASRVDSGTGGPPTYLPKPRAPSPGLLQRMQSWEKEATDSSTLTRPGGPSGERKQSVDNLKKLYEERAGAVASLRPTSRDGGQ